MCGFTGSRTSLSQQTPEQVACAAVQNLGWLRKTAEFAKATICTQLAGGGGMRPALEAAGRSSATFALNSGACCLRFDISDLLLVEDPQTANRSLGQCPNFQGWLSVNQHCESFIFNLHMILGKESPPSAAGQRPQAAFFTCLKNWIAVLHCVVIVNSALDADPAAPAASRPPCRAVPAGGSCDLCLEGAGVRGAERC